MAETAKKIIDLDLLTRYDGKIKNKIDTADQNLQNQINAINQAASGYATKSELGSYAKKTDLDSYATKTDLDGYASKQSVTDINSEITDIKEDLAGKVDGANFNALADTVTGHGTRITNLENAASNYATKTDLDGYASKQSVTDLSADIVALENKMVFASTDDIDALFA